MTLFKIAALDHRFIVHVFDVRAMKVAILNRHGDAGIPAWEAQYINTLSFRQIYSASRFASSVVLGYTQQHVLVIMLYEINFSIVEIRYLRT
ncbi:hypothetical protein D9M68_570550 [compost metagenome]